MAQDISSTPAEERPGGGVEGDLDMDSVSPSDSEFDDVLEINPFDGLPYSSRFYTLLKERTDLPVWKAKSYFMDCLSSNQFVIVSGSAKTGRSSQIPQWCTELSLAERYDRGMVVCTETSGQQAVDLALRVADEMDVNIGHEVGYSVPQETCCSGDTVLRFCTDSMLLREMKADPQLRRYGVVVVDQAHQRTLATDLLLGLLRDVGRRRPELRMVLLTSSHPGPRLLGHYHAGSTPSSVVGPHIQLESPAGGEVVFSGGGDYFCSSVRLVLEIHHSKEEGDVVVFLVTAQELDLACDLLWQEGSSLPPALGQLCPTPVHPGRAGSLPSQPASGGRRVFLTSSPNEDFFWAVGSIKFVIDAGLGERYVYIPRTRTYSAMVQPISRGEAVSRRQLTGPTGKCFCLYPEDRLLPDETHPHILECDITSSVLFLKRMELSGVGPCDFIDRPEPEGLMQALEELDYLAALDDDGNLSEMGIIMSEFPLDPQMAKTLLASCEFDCVDEVVTIAAMLTAPSCFRAPSVGLRADPSCRSLMKFQHPAGDHFTLINVFKAFQQSRQDPYCRVEEWCEANHLSLSALRSADRLRDELIHILRRTELPISTATFGCRSNTLNIKRALLAGFFMQVAQETDGSGNYLILTNKHVAQIHPLSGYGARTPKLGLPQWVLFHHFSFWEDNCLRTVTRIAPEEFIEMVPQYFFYNLPLSGSKEFLQDLLNHGSPHSPGRETASLEEEQQADTRCVVQ
ncbi:putative pre-mRNA-splicing factor ATP-dependent RNA helicase DHX32 [Gadus morhua]|uniref:putative pre-mRNA-splicing factor ATP-dependent RNA helicase DHX32 n=1 Tax=Gadus morhua TaxID=8049 RepID=UPI0011B530C5|nr:putative pre-mRNA-splicing factor ATP-dependent RNA helicase DHX32 [Gadus morhua]